MDKGVNSNMLHQLKDIGDITMDYDKTKDTYKS